MGALEHVGPIIPFELLDCKLLSIAGYGVADGAFHVHEGGRSAEFKGIGMRARYALFPTIEGPAIFRSRKEGSG